MLSVTQRISMVSQPRGGYINPKTMHFEQFRDGIKLYDIPFEYKSIQGLAVDYYTRYLTGTKIEDAFKVSLYGAKIMGETEKARELLNGIPYNRKQAIINVCKLVGYDVAYRKGKEFFKPIEQIVPSEELIHNVIVMVKRSLDFFKEYGPVYKSGFYCVGKNGGVISSGDGDYLTEDAIWDFKASENEPNSENTLQILMYYLLGYNSIFPWFKNIKKIGIYNPLLNNMYAINISDISDEVMNNVCRDVIGYDISENFQAWKNASGVNSKVIEEITERFPQYVPVRFSPDKFEDGIYENISLSDYWDYYMGITYPRIRPKFQTLKSITLYKKNGYMMFIATTDKNDLRIMHGGRLYKLKYPLEFYYEYMDVYAKRVLEIFSKYWQRLYGISEQLKSIEPDMQTVKKVCYPKYIQNGEIPFDWYCKYLCGNFSGKVHGCIVDIDYKNHIFVNPYDGSLTPYNAFSVKEKYVYKDITTLIKTERPEMLKGFKQMAKNNGLLFSNNNKLIENSESVLKVNKDDDISEKEKTCELVADTEIYKISGKIKALQYIYDNKLIVAWYDNLLKSNGIEE